MTLIIHKQTTAFSLSTLNIIPPFSYLCEMIKAAIFDMDGLLINSEPFWRESMKRCFARVELTLTEEMCILTMGKKINEVIDHWYNFQPWPNADLKALESEIVEGVRNLILEKGMAMNGVDHILNFCKQKKIKIGLASSSALLLIEAALMKLNIRECFEVVHSAEFEAFGKPHPDVYLTAAKRLNVSPAECMVFEDSYNGLLSAKAAGMKSIAIPEDSTMDTSKLDIADLKLVSLSDFNEASWAFLNK